MEEYKQWLEQQIERCLNDKDLQREHWAFCKAYEKFTALRKHAVMQRSEQLAAFLEWYWKNVDGRPFDARATDIVESYGG